MQTLSKNPPHKPPIGPLVAIATEGMSIDDVQEFYDRLCKKYKKLSVKAFLIHTDEESLKRTGRPLNYRGLYIEWPFRKIYLKANDFTERVVLHEIFHHLNPHLMDGPEFERLLDEFEKTDYL